MDRKVFEKFREIIHREAGIALGAEKQQLLTNRIQKRLQALKLQNARDYLNIVELDMNGDELINLIDVVSTNVTYFYREGEHFALLPDLFDSLVAQGRSDLKIWCAAASSGEEPYTLAMMVEEHAQLRRSSTKILATDISLRILRKAQRGQYHANQLDKLPTNLRSRYLSPLVVEDEERWGVAEVLRERVLFKRLNLAKFPYPLTGPLDLIFCRNVMIYFDIKLRQQIVEEFWRLLRPGGVVCLSHSENLLGVTHGFEPYAVAVYQKPLSSGVRGGKSR